MQGTTLDGRYHILGVLDSGGFSHTYLAQDMRRPGRPRCVVKRLHPLHATPDYLRIARRLFEQEAEVLETLGGFPHVPQLLAYFEADEDFFLIQEWIEGATLQEGMGQTWNETQARHFLQEMLTILDYIHSRGFIHRDIKPRNVMRRHGDERLFLIDFGSAKKIAGMLTAAAELDARTVAIGTQGYMAPEQAQGFPRVNSDLYALGMMTLQGVTGHPPSHWQGNSDWQKRTPAPLRELLLGLTESDPDRRIASATEALELLNNQKPSPWPWMRWWQKRQSPPPAGASALSPTPDTMVEQEHTLALHQGSPTQLVTQATTGRRVFIAHRDQAGDRQLASRLHEQLQILGHQPFMAQKDITLGENWAQRIDHELEACDYFLLLLSPAAARSEMVTEEVRKAWDLQQRTGKPAILPIRVHFPMSDPLNYELRAYLQGIQQRSWTGEEDTPAVVEAILTALKQERFEPPNTDGEVSALYPLPAPADGRPLPVAEPVLPEGQVQLDSAFYVERPPIEERCYQRIMQPGSLIRIKAPRQMGKTSLMARILHHAQSEGAQVVSLSFQLADGKVFADLNHLLRWFCSSISRRLKLPNRVADYWDDLLGSKDNCSVYFEEYLLPACEGPLVLGLDEVDRVFAYPEIAEDFFGLLRAWHEEAKNQALWQSLRLVVVHATEVYVKLNIHQSPFNVGLPIELKEFSPPQVAQLAQLHGWDSGDRRLALLLDLLAGHPYLTRLAMYSLSKGDLQWEQFLHSAPTEAGIFSDHLRRHWWILRQYPDLFQGMAQVIAHEEGVRLPSEVMFQLQSMGLVRMQGNLALPRCRLYQDYFRDYFHNDAQVS